MKSCVASQDSCGLSEQLRLLGVWVSEALFCRNCYLGCIDCVCSTPAVSVFLLPLFYFLFSTLWHPPNPSHNAWPSEFSHRAMNAQPRRWARLGPDSSVCEWQLDGSASPGTCELGVQPPATDPSPNRFG